VSVGSGSVEVGAGLVTSSKSSSSSMCTSMLLTGELLMEGIGTGLPPATPFVLLLLLLLVISESLLTSSDSSLKTLSLSIVSLVVTVVV